MTVGHYLNMEIVARESIGESLDKMTESNVKPIAPEETFEILDDDALRNNLKYGFNALVMMCVFAECVINDLVRMKYQEMFYRDEFDHLQLERQLKTALRKGIEAKVKKELGICCSSDADAEFAKKWSHMMSAINLRNELIHYKSNYMQESILPDPHTWELPGIMGVAQPSSRKKTSIGYAFTQSNMRYMWENIWQVITIIADKQGCVFDDDAQFISSDGRDGIASFIVPKKAVGLGDI